MADEKRMPPQAPLGAPPAGGPPSDSKKDAGGPPAGMPGGHRGGPMANRMNAEKPKNTKQALLRLVKYIGKSKGSILLLLIFTLVSTGVDIIFPKLQQQAIDTISVDGNGFAVDLKQMLVYLGFMLVFAVISALVGYFSGLVSAKLSQDTVFILRNDLFRKISRLPIRYTDTHRHGDIMSRMTNDVENISNAVTQSITTFVSGILTLVGAFVMMLSYNLWMTLLALVTIPLTIFVSTSLAKFMRKYFIRQQQLLGKLNGHVEEMVTGYRTVVAYGKEEEAVRDFSETSNELRKCAISARVWGSIMGPIMNFLGNLQYVILAAMGGFFMLNGYGHMTIGSIQAMLQYSKKFSQPINMIASQYSSILTALAGAERIFEILDSPDEVDEGTEKIDIPAVRGEIDFSDLHFGYNPEEPVLKGMNLHVLPGQKVAIVGATGSGKTTVVNLLMRFYEPDSGLITVDGKDIRKIPKEQLRRTISIVLQDTVLFNDTIRSNIKYGRLEADDEAMKASAHTAMADRFIDRLPENYDTMLAESGSNLSQGQRQLLSISRAVLADPRILILDEATSSVDTRTEMQIQQAMVNLMKGRTSLIIAHRLSTIRDADVIVVVKDGVIAESGSHDALLEQKGEYFKLYSKQFAGQTI